MKDNVNDKVYTPDHIVDDVMENYSHLVNMQDTIMEPFKGGGSFYNKLIEYSDHPVSWCEVDEGVDFFKCETKVDWIITNPPYSIFKDILPRCLELPDNNIFVIPVNKLLSSVPRLMDIKRAGHGIKEVYYLGSGRQLKFPFGFPVAAIWIQKGHDSGVIKEKYHPRCYGAKRKINR